MWSAGAADANTAVRAALRVQSVLHHNYNLTRDDRTAPKRAMLAPAELLVLLPGDTASPRQLAAIEIAFICAEADHNDQTTAIWSV